MQLAAWGMVMNPLIGILDHEKDTFRMLTIRANWLVDEYGLNMTDFFSTDFFSLSETSCGTFFLIG